jgi:hypothetical protein
MLCERTATLSLDEAREMSVEDLVLVATVREHIRSKSIQFGVNSNEISRRVEAMQAGTLGPATDDEWGRATSPALSPATMEPFPSSMVDGAIGSNSVGRGKVKKNAH